MKLLARSDIQRLKADEYRREREEGMKLARRVDSLRELSSVEEKSLEDFRKKTLEQIHKEITEASSKKEALIGEVRDLEKRRKKALAPLDKELEVLKEERLALDEGKEYLAQFESNLNLQKMRQDAREKTLTVLESQVKSTNMRAHALLEETEKKNQNAANLEEKALALLTRTQTYAKKTEKDLKTRSEEIAAKEQGVIMRATSLHQRERALEKEWKLLNDRKAMYERIIKHNEKTNGT